MSSSSNHPLSSTAGSNHWSSGFAAALPDASEASADYEDEEGDDAIDIEAQEGIPVTLPGAFAIEGMEAGQSAVLYDSEADDDSHGGGDDTIPNAAALEQATIPQFHVPAEATIVVGDVNSPLEAELQVVVEGAVVNDDEDDDVNLKAIKRLRMVQSAILCFSMAALALIVGSVLGFAHKKGRSTYSGEPILTGWSEVGTSIFGPMQDPQIFFASAVALSGNGTRIAITAPGTGNASSLDLGELWILDETDSTNGTTWGVVAILNGTQPSQDARMSLAMSADGQRIAVGRPLANVPEITVYEENAFGWEEIGALRSNNTASWFGYSIAMSLDGGTLVIGTPLADSGTFKNNGLVSVYQLDATAHWVQVGDDILGDAVGELLGWSVAVQANGSAGGALRVVAGGPAGNSEKGSAKAYDWTGSTWVQVGATLEGTDELGRFGDSVALSADGTTLAVGAAGTAFLPGKVRVFREVNAQWVEDTTAEFLGIEPAEAFGTSLAMSNDGSVLAIGAPLSDSNRGRVQVLKYDSTVPSWTTQGSYIYGDPGDEFGSAVAVSSDGMRVLGGAPAATYDGSVAQAGTARVYDRLQ